MDPQKRQLQRKRNAERPSPAFVTLRINGGRKGLSLEARGAPAMAVAVAVGMALLIWAWAYWRPM